MAANEPISIRAGEQCHVSTNGMIYQGTIVSTTTSTVSVKINAVLYRFSRRYARRTRLQRLIIEVTG